MSAKKVTDAEIRDMEAKQLTIARSAFILGIHHSTLIRRAKRMQLIWGGKGKSFMDYAHEKNSVIK